MKPPQLQHKIVPGPVKYISRIKGEVGHLDSEQIPDVNLGRDHTFLTAMNVENHEIFKNMQNQQQRESQEESQHIKTGFTGSKMSQKSKGPQNV